MLNSHMITYQWVPDLPDLRDYKYLKTGLVIPTQKDLRDKMSPVEDQSTIGSCTGNAIVGLMEFLENLKGGVFTDLSRLFVYYNERLMEGTTRRDAGAVIRDGIKTVSNFGVCSEVLWPYDITKFKLFIQFFGCFHIMLLIHFLRH